MLQDRAGSLRLAHPPHAKQSLVQVDVLGSHSSSSDGPHKSEGQAEPSLVTPSPNPTLSTFIFSYVIRLQDM